MAENSAQLDVIVKMEPKDIVQTVFKEEMDPGDQDMVTTIKEEPNYDVMKTDNTSKDSEGLPNSPSEVEFESKEMLQPNEDAEFEPKCDSALKIEREDTEPLCQLEPFADDQVQDLDGNIKNEVLLKGASNSDKMKSKEDINVITRITESFRLPSSHGNKNLEPERCNDNQIINDSTLQDYPSYRTPIHKRSHKFSYVECGKSFDHRENLNRNINISTNTPSFSCEVCAKSFKRRYCLKRHMNIHASNPRFSCDVCGKSFNCSDALNSHPCNPCSCEVCGKTFKREDNLKRHTQIHTSGPKFPCKVCGKYFTRKSNLRHHIDTHTGNRPFTCEVCGKSFGTKTHLKTHLNIHAGKRPFSCQLCGISFKLNGILKRHMSVHVSVLSLSCDVCGKSFKTADTLRNHMKIHSSNLTFSCEFCGKCFGVKSYLREHLYVHTANHTFSCKVCGKSFKRRQELNRHKHSHIQTFKPPTSSELSEKSFKKKSMFL